jgi:tetratricopeptide (TPR) repeat protein
VPDRKKFGSDGVKERFEMKRVLVTFVLALTTCALAQGNTQQPPAQQPPAQQPSAQQPAASGAQQPGSESQANIPTSQKVIKDPAEYNAYITALNTQDPAQKGAAMEAFVNQYPNSIVKMEALEQAMAAYDTAKNSAKVEAIATQIRQIDPNNVRALAIITALKQSQAATPQQFAELQQLGEQGIQALPNWKKPDGMSDADFTKFKTSMQGIFVGAAGFGALQAKDYAAAKRYYAQALEIEPNNYANSYRLAIADLEGNPMDLNGFWYGAHAVALAQSQNNAAAVNSMKPYLTSKYQRYHGGVDGWDQLVASAATGTAPPAGFTIKPAPTLCDLAANAVQQNGAEGLSFADRETILSCRDKSPANKTAADAVWQNLQTLQKNGEAKLKIPGVKIIAAPDNNTLEVAVSEDNQKANKADMKVEMEKPMTKLPAVGSMTDIIGVISDYTPDPFMFTMTKGELPKPAAKKAPARRRTTRRH